MRKRVFSIPHCLIYRSTVLSYCPAKLLTLDKERSIGGPSQAFFALLAAVRFTPADHSLTHALGILIALCFHGAIIGA
jgi:hypothetical protein